MGLSCLNYAQKTYGSEFVPGCEDLGVRNGLYVYTLAFVPCATLETARKQLF